MMSKSSQLLGGKNGIKNDIKNRYIFRAIKIDFVETTLETSRETTPVATLGSIKFDPKKTEND